MSPDPLGIAGGANLLAFDGAPTVEVDPWGLTGCKKEGGTLVRFGPGPETLEKLAADAAAAENAGLPHGVSAKLVDRASGSDKRHRLAPIATVREHFTVEQTGRNPRHHTVHLPKPVNQDAVDAFNSIFVAG